MKILVVFLLLIVLALSVGQTQAMPMLMGLKIYLPIVMQEPVDRTDVLEWLNQNGPYTCTALQGDQVLCRQDSAQFDLPFEATLAVDEVQHYHLYTDRTLMIGCYPYGLCRVEWPFR